MDEEQIDFDIEQAPTTVDGIYKALRKPIKKLNISYLNLRCNLKDIKKITTIVANNSNLTELNLTSTQIKDFGVIALAKCLKSNDALTNITLYDNQISDRGVRSLAESLVTNSTLSKLDLGGNVISNAGARALGKALKHNNALIMLHLDDNLISDEGALYLSEAIAFNRALSLLDLYDNKIGEVGALALAKALESNEMITSLSIDRSVEEDTIGEPNYKRFGQEEKDLRPHFTVESISKLQYIKTQIKSLLTRNQRAQQAAFLEARESEELHNWKRGKLMIIGDEKAGKSATVRSLLNENYVPEWISTVGISVTECYSSTPMWKKSFEMDHTSSFVHTIAARKKLKLYTKTFKRFGDDADLFNFDEDIIAARMGEFYRSSSVENYAENQFNRFMFAKAKTRHDMMRISIWDYGGQSFLHILHHLFLTRNGVYLFVMNMRNFFKDKNTEIRSLEFWLKSVHLQAPEAPVLIVGTFLDETSTVEIKEIERSLRKVCRNRFPQLRKPTNLHFFPIDNKTKAGVIQLRNGIESALNEVSDWQVAVKWTRFLDKILNSNKPWISLKNAKEAASSEGLTSCDEVDQLLKTFHELGLIIYFPRTESLKDVITLKPHWLLHAISRVIGDRKIPEQELGKLQEHGLEDDLQLFWDEGLASRDLLEFLWEGYQVDFLLDLMRHLLLLSSWKFEDSDSLYLAPWMVQSTFLDSQLCGIKCQMEFQFLPHGVFERIVCQWVELSSQAGTVYAPTLRKGSCRIWINKKCSIYLQNSQDRIVIYISEPNYSASVIAVLFSMIRKLRGDIIGNEFKPVFKLQNGNKMVSYDWAKKHQIKPWFQQETSNSKLQISRCGHNLEIL